jgi:hypothetical protein
LNFKSLFTSSFSHLETPNQVDSFRMKQCLKEAAIWHPSYSPLFFFSLLHSISYTHKSRLFKVKRRLFRSTKRCLLEYFFSTFVIPSYQLFTPSNNQFSVSWYVFNPPGPLFLSVSFSYLSFPLFGSFFSSC